MIPLRLELANFLSYRENTVLDLRGVHTACIAGANGAGKSSLLDAITWALFGQSRSKSDDDVVNRAGAREGGQAEVRFSFALEGSVYRVLRSKKPGRSTSLELQLEAEPDRWRSLSEGRVRETQAAIEALLKMSYDTFINASFLLQGKADEFTMKTPNRRKEILADLLGVSRWDQYRDAANARRREAEGQLQLLDARVADIDAELGEEAERQAELERQEQEQRQLAERLADREKILTELRRRQEAVRHQREMVEGLARSVTHAQAALAEARATGKRRQAERAEHASVLERSEAIEADHAAWQRLDEQVRAWGEKERAAGAVRERMRPHELAIAAALSRLEQQVAGLSAQKERIAGMQAERTSVVATLEKRQAELAAMAADLAALTVTETAYREARERFGGLRAQRQSRAQERDRLSAEAERIALERQQLETLQAALDDAGPAIADLGARLAALQADNDRLLTATAERNGIEAQQPALRDQMNALQERIRRLEDETGGDCPLCGQPLSEAHRQAVLAELKGQGRTLGDRFRANQEKRKALDTEIAALETRVRARSGVERELTAQQSRQASSQTQLAELERRLEQWERDGAVRLDELTRALAEDPTFAEAEREVARLAEAVAERPALEQARQACQEAIAAATARLGTIDRASADWQASGSAELATAEAELAGDAFAAEHREALAALQVEWDAVGYDEAAHREARAGRDALSQAPAALSQLKEARAAVGTLDVALADLERQIAGQEQHLAGLVAQHAAAEEALAALSAGDDDLPAVEADVDALRTEVSRLNQRVGGARQQLAVLDDRRRQKTSLIAERAERTQHIARLKLLERACGRDGVQALLIEQALPEIEESANELLERLTSGEMRILFETQRQLRSRDALAETLDIRIADNVGERPYENFSGGEQFRVNFAIRLALSRVLAGRAGARLQTLVIDEGFGSQDPQGRQRLVEAINTIQDQFACILVITHIDQLRDAFPTRILVEKGPAGSMVTIL